MTKHKKRHNEEIRDINGLEKSPKRVEVSKPSKSPKSGRSSKRTRLEINLSNEKGHGQLNHPSGTIPSAEKLNSHEGPANGIDDVPENASVNKRDESRGSEKSPRKKFMKSTDAEAVEGQNEATNDIKNGQSLGVNGQSIASNISGLFSEHDRLLPGAKRSAMAVSYSSSTP